MSTYPMILNGVRFSSLVAVKRTADGKWLCSCDCGGTCERKTEQITRALKLGKRANCGCESLVPVTYAVTFRGELTKIPDLAPIVGVNVCVMYRWARAGKLTESFVEDYMRKRALRQQAKAMGISAKLATIRVARGMSYEEARTKPVSTQHRTAGKGNGRKVAA